MDNVHPECGEMRFPFCINMHAQIPIMCFFPMDGGVNMKNTLAINMLETAKLYTMGRKTHTHTCSEKLQTEKF